MPDFITPVPLSIDWKGQSHISQDELSRPSVRSTAGEVIPGRQPKGLLETLLRSMRRLGVYR